MTAEEAQPGLAEVYPTATVQDLNGTSVVAFLPVADAIAASFTAAQ